MKSPDDDKPAAKLDSANTGQTFEGEVKDKSKS
jgi:hypothetical protein